MARYKRSKAHVYVHFVWATRNRLPLVTPDIERRLYRCLVEICERHACPVFAVGGMPDHVHLLVLLSPKISVSELIKNVKGGSSRFVSSELKPGDWFDWQDHYGAFSVSPRERRKIIDYIENQKQHHAEGTLYPNAEETDEESEIEMPEPSQGGRHRVRSTHSGTLLRPGIYSWDWDRIATRYVSCNHPFCHTDAPYRAYLFP